MGVLGIDPVATCALHDPLPDVQIPLLQLSQHCWGCTVFVFTEAHCLIRGKIRLSNRIVTPCSQKPESCTVFQKQPEQGWLLRTFTFILLLPKKIP